MNVLKAKGKIHRAALQYLPDGSAVLYRRCGTGLEVVGRFNGKVVRLESGWEAVIHPPTCGNCLKTGRTPK